MTSVNHFSILPIDLETVKVSKKKDDASKTSFVIPEKSFVPKKATDPKKPSVPKKDIVLEIQTLFPLIAIFWSGSTNNEFVICKTKISSTLKLKKNATRDDLSAKINKMKGLYSCMVWNTTINTPELKMMIENQYALPAKYQPLHDLLCDDTIKSTKRQNVIVLDFRRPHLKGHEYVYLKNHQQFFFGSIRESYLDRKSEVNGLQKYYDNFYHRFNFPEFEKIAFECHKFADTFADADWLKYREDQIRLLKEADSVFELSDAKIFERFPSFEDLKKEIDQAIQYKKELEEMLPKMKSEYDRKMIVHEIHDPEAFPSL